MFALLYRCAVYWRVWSRSISGRRTGVVEQTNWVLIVRRITLPLWSANTWSRKRPSSRYRDPFRLQYHCSFLMTSNDSHISVFVCFQACTLARRNADVFLKYMHRNSVNMPGMLSHVKAPEQQVKSEFAERCRRTGYLRMFAVIHLQSTANKWLCFLFHTHTVHADFLRLSFYQPVFFCLLSLEAYLNTAGLPTGEICISFLVCLALNSSSVVTSSGEEWHHMVLSFLTRVVVAATDPLRSSLAQFVVCSISAPPPFHSVLFRDLMTHESGNSKWVRPQHCRTRHTVSGGGSILCLHMMHTLRDTPHYQVHVLFLQL